MGMELRVTLPDLPDVGDLRIAVASEGRIHDVGAKATILEETPTYVKIGPALGDPMIGDVMVCFYRPVHLEAVLRGEVLAATVHRWGGQHWNIVGPATLTVVDIHARELA